MTINALSISSREKKTNFRYMEEYLKKKMDRIVEWCIYSYGFVRFRKEINRCKNGQCPFCGKKINSDEFIKKIDANIDNMIKDFDNDVKSSIKKETITELEKRLNKLSFLIIVSICESFKFN